MKIYMACPITQGGHKIAVNKNRGRSVRSESLSMKAIVREFVKQKRCMIAARRLNRDEVMQIWSVNGCENSVCRWQKLYSLHLLLWCQWTYDRLGVIWRDFDGKTREFLYLRLIGRLTVIKFTVHYVGDDGNITFAISVRVDTPKFTKMIISGFGGRWNLTCKAEVFIENKAEQSEC